MAVLDLSFLRALSFGGADAMLRQEGYVKEACMETDSGACGRVFRYPYVLYSGGRRVDRICYVEYCRQVADVEYTDGRMTWEPVKEGWERPADGTGSRVQGRSAE